MTEQPYPKREEEPSRQASPTSEPSATPSGAGRYWCVVERDALRVTGPQAEQFLQGQLTQDLARIGLDSHGWSWLLEPTGKVVALLRVFHPAEQEWVLETDSGWGEAVLARLARFKLRTKADIVAAAATLLCCRGEGWTLEGPLVAEPSWPGVLGADQLYLDGFAKQSVSGTGTGTGTGTADGDAYWDGGGAVTVPAPSDEPPATPGVLEAQRIASGQPRMGAELTERTIPAETGLIDLTVSFTKGCYTGQELVARIDSRGNHVARRMVRLRLDGQIAPGSDLFDRDLAGQEPRLGIGRVTSVGFSEHLGWVGLGYLERKAGSPEVLRAGGVGVRVID